MAKFVKVILCLLFAIAFYAAVNELSATKGVERIISAPMYAEGVQTTVAAVQLPYLPDAELVGGGMQVQQITMSRVQRINVLEYVSSLKSLFRKLANRDAVLSQHLNRLYDTTTYYRCHPASEYYVFALRHIVV